MRKNQQPDLAALFAAFVASQSGAAPIAATAAPSWMTSTNALNAAANARPKATAAPKPEKAPKAFGGRTWTRLADAPSSYPGYPASAVFVSSSQPNKPRYIPLDLVEAILSSK